MTLCRHIRRPDPAPHGGWWVLRCDCGWEGRTAQLDDIRPRGRQVVEDALSAAFLAHLGPDERRTYLLCDARPPDNGADAGEPQIVGNFVMPEGTAVRLLEDRVEDGVHFGTYLLDGITAELPIGEVRTPDGRVFRLDQ